MTSMASPRIISCSLLLLLAVVRSASVGGQSAREGILPAAAPDFTTPRTTINTTEDNSDDVARIAAPELLKRDEKHKVDRDKIDNDEAVGERREDKGAKKEEGGEEEYEEDDNDGNDDDGDEGDDNDENDDGNDGDDDDNDDEYEDELKAIAESHEAMSKDEARNSNAPSAANKQSEAKLSSARSFDSREKSNENVSDEDVASNEAIISEIIEKGQDSEVAELLKYKMERNAKTKAKRVPTVKKELSTQKEILLASSNETQVPKSLLPSEDPFNRLSGKTDYVQRRSLEGNEVQEVALARSLLNLLAKLTEDPSRWQRVHKFLTNMENDLQVSKSIQDPVKRDYDTTSMLFSTTPSAATAPKKNRKKLKKKKKKPRHQQVSTTTSITTTATPETSTPSTPSTTTETWSVTPQWRLVAERLFGSPWKQDPIGEFENVARARIDGADSKPHALPSIWEFIDQNKPKNIMRIMNTERTPLLLDFPKESDTQSRTLRFGKVNGYQPLRLQDFREFNTLYDRSTDSDRLVDYYPSEAVYSRQRYNPSREFLLRRNENDYQDDLTLQTDNFAYNQEYKPSSREFANSKSWPNFSYTHSRPWNSDEQSPFSTSSNKWPWGHQNGFKHWPERRKYLEKNNWSTLGSEEDDYRMDQAEIEEWQQQRLPYWETSRSNIWPIEETMKLSPLWSQTDRAVKSNDQLIAWDKSKNHSELNKKENINDKVILPKITMKTWNSLTSDPATWPYKLPSAKPWPKDENGKSYNPNADLVKKLGLDKEDNGNWPKDKDEKSGRLVFQKHTDSVTSKDADSKKKELITRLNDSKYKPINNKSNYNDYKKQQQGSMKEMPNWMYQNVRPSKEWIKPQTASNLPKDSEVSIWNGKFEVFTENKVKSANPKDENSSFSSFWPLNAASSNERKWSDKERDDLTKSWKETAKDNNSPNVKSDNSWLSKAKNDLWTTKTKSGSWDSKLGDNSWISKADNNAFWMLKTNDESSWTTNADIWPGKSNNMDSWSPSSQGSNNLASWTVKEKSEDSWTRSNNPDWPQKTKDNNSWTSKLNVMAPWKNNDDNWSRKAERNSWRQKINDDWNISYGKNSAGTWPSKWKQFAYHKVTAVPISKPGTTADVSSPKSKNAFVAVSAVSSSANYNENDWRKNDVEEAMHEDNFRLEETDRSSNQIRQSESKRPIYAWKKDNSELNNDVRRKNNSTERLENQLETLRQNDFWPYKNELEAGEESAYHTTSSTVQPATVANRTTTSQFPQKQITSKSTEKRPRGYQQEILMK